MYRIAGIHILGPPIPAFEYMDVRRADLHTHTVCSDGKLTPEELVRKVHAHGIRALAVTDHDSIDAYAAATAAGERLGVEIVSGVELSVTVDEQEIHLLGYFFDVAHDGLNEHLVTFRRRRAERAEQIVALLNRMGIQLAMAEVLVFAKDGVVGRPHIAQAMVAQGYAASYDDAFGLYLKDYGPAYVPKPLFPASDAIALLRGAGGISSLAHPGTRVDYRTIDRLIKAGLDGIETVHPSHGYVLTRQYKQLTRDRGLIETGGSDYHGFRPEEDENLTRYSIPYRRLERLRSAAA